MNGVHLETAKSTAFVVNIAAALFLTLSTCHGQGTLQFNFDGPPLIPAGSAIGVQIYDEAGMRFTPLTNSFTFGRIGVNPRLERPDNGTSYLQAALTQSLTFRFIDDSLFNLLSVDLAEYSTVVSNAVTVPFIGYRPDGSMVTTDFTTDGIIDGTGPVADFQTFYFGPEFSGLTRVEIPTYGWSLDNVVVSVPEPTSAPLAVAGFCLWWLFRKRTRELSLPESR